MRVQQKKDELLLTYDNVCLNWQFFTLDLRKEKGNVLELSAFFTILFIIIKCPADSIGEKNKIYFWRSWETNTKSTVGMKLPSGSKKNWAPASEVLNNVESGTPTQPNLGNKSARKRDGATKKTKICMNCTSNTALNGHFLWNISSVNLRTPLKIDSIVVWGKPRGNWKS